MRKKLLGCLLTGAIVACMAFVVVLFLIKALWAWTIPDLFPGAVAQGLVAGTVSWFTAAKIAIFAAVLAAIAGVRHGSGRKK
jgi:hypothetical protein